MMTSSRFPERVSLEFAVTRNVRGDLEARSAFPLGFERRELRIHTYKSYYGVVSIATVVQVSEDGRSYSYAAGLGANVGDFNRRVFHEPKMRATAANIKRVHGDVLAGLANLLALAYAHYGQPFQA